MDATTTEVRPITLDVLIRKMVDLKEIIEAGKAAERQLNECRSIAEEAMDRGTSYRTRSGDAYQHDELHRLDRDCELVWEIGRRADRPIVDSATVAIDPGLISGRAAEFLAGRA